ncbi:PAS domain-containing protein [Wolbachia endosymbiont of Chironomus riparius]|uniref:PAS domain-containing protein n=1 Tax=Wolbachia endosymbiont of Chironomus riparius TaxID=2883238 RepID=UPI00209D4EC9|nr:PAS-domain containing protein [Wolbachia endosymbiont of Chironomus riparius]
MIGVLLWVRNISNYEIRSNELKLENKKLVKEIENYKDIFNSLSYPILKYNKYQKVKFYNLFYHKHINNSQRLAITKIVYNEKSEKYITIYGNERKIFNFIKVSIQGSDEIVVYGQDISNEEKLRTKLNNHLVTYKMLLEDLPVAIVIYNKSQKITFYNNTFIRIFQLDHKFLKSRPTYYEIMSYLFESKKLLKKEDFQVITEKRDTLFKELFESYNNTLHLTNGKLLKVLTINYASEGLLFSYTECKKS